MLALFIAVGPREIDVIRETPHFQDMMSKFVKYRRMVADGQGHMDDMPARYVVSPDGFPVLAGPGNVNLSPAGSGDRFEIKHRLVNADGQRPARKQMGMADSDAVLDQFEKLVESPLVYGEGSEIIDGNTLDGSGLAMGGNDAALISQTDGSKAG